jgi:hypothetical protein
MISLRPLSRGVLNGTCRGSVVRGGRPGLKAFPEERQERESPPASSKLMRMRL